MKESHKVGFSMQQQDGNNLHTFSLPVHDEYQHEKNLKAISHYNFTWANGMSGVLTLQILTNVSQKAW